MSQVQWALDQMQFVRGYTQKLLDTIPTEDWFRQPAGFCTHIAWQVGHLAIAQYRLALQRTRGIHPGDKNLLPANYLTLFGKDTVPVSDSGLYPTPTEILEVFHRVHSQVMSEMRNFPESEWELPPYAPHALVNTRGGCLLMASQHEMLHAGQIGMLRRLYGMPPAW